VGLDCDDGAFPVQYLGANVPQAWASGAVIHLVTTLTGIYADGPSKRLVVKPILPDWLPEVTLANLRVGEATVDLHITRDRAEILDSRGELEVTSSIALAAEQL
jgi:hypothetical protein